MFFFVPASSVIHEDHGFGETSFCPVRTVVPPQGAIFGSNQPQLFQVFSFCHKCVLVRWTVARWSSFSIFLLCPAIPATSYSICAGNVCHHMVTRGLARCWIKKWSYERTRTITESTPRGHSQRVHITSRTLRSHHTHFNLPTQSHIQLLMLLTVKFPRTIVSTTSVSMFTSTRSAARALHFVFCGTAISLTVTRLSLSTNPFDHNATHPLWPPVFGAAVPPAPFLFIFLSIAVFSTPLHPDSPFDRLCGCVL